MINALGMENLQAKVSELIGQGKGAQEVAKYLVGELRKESTAFQPEIREINKIVASPTSEKDQFIDIAKFCVEKKKAIDKQVNESKDWVWMQTIYKLALVQYENKKTNPTRQPKLPISVIFVVFASIVSVFLLFGLFMWVGGFQIISKNKLPSNTAVKTPQIEIESNKADVSDVKDIKDADKPETSKGIEKDKRIDPDIIKTTPQIFYYYNSSTDNDQIISNIINELNGYYRGKILFMKTTIRDSARAIIYFETKGDTMMYVDTKYRVDKKDRFTSVDPKMYSLGKGKEKIKETIKLGIKQ